MEPKTLSVSVNKPEFWIWLFIQLCDKLYLSQAATSLEMLMHPESKNSSCYRCCFCFHTLNMRINTNMHIQHSTIICMQIYHISRALLTVILRVSNHLLVKYGFVILKVHLNKLNTMEVSSLPHDRVSTEPDSTRKCKRTKPDSFPCVWACRHV